MKLNQQTQQQIERSLKKIIAKFPAGNEPVMTDIHLLVSPYTGEITTYDDDDKELDRCVVNEWIKTDQDGFYDRAARTLQHCIENLRPSIKTMSVLQPFSFVLIDEDHETLQDLSVIDQEETVVVSGGLLENLDKELDDFLQELLKD